MILAALALAAAVQAQQAEPALAPAFVWWEAEAAATTNFAPPNRNPFAPEDAAQAAVLSGGAWMGVADPRTEALFLEYAIDVPPAAAEGAWTLYARKFWRHGPFRWRFDDGDWRTCSKDAALLDDTPVRKFVGAHWVRLGDLSLAPGRRRFRVELLEPDGPAAFDCFVLARAGFTPRGRMKPGEKWDRAPEGWFPFEPDRDAIAGSPISLRSLNETAAGEKGRVIARDGGFAHEPTGEPVRFWGVNVGHDTLALDPADMDALARRLASLGVNLVRIHGPLWRGDLTPDPDRIARLRLLAAALKREGVYTSLSIYFPLWLELKEEQGFAGYSGQHPFGLLFFSPDFQRLYREWWRAVLGTPDGSGLTLAADPAIAMCELVNEDSLFFWTFKPYETIPAEQMPILERQFGDWLAARHGSPDGALWKWNVPRSERLKGDEPGSGRIGIIAAGDLARLRGPRARETAEFLAHTQRRFFEEHRRFLKEDLGYGGLVIGSNWLTADPKTLGPLDKWSNTVCDVMDRHGYFSGEHRGPRAAWAIDPGDTYTDRSALRFNRVLPHEFWVPVTDVTYNGLPSMISEVNWAMPNRFRAEFPLLAAAYGSLAGTDGICLFSSAGPGWSQSLRKFDIDSPAILGQSPAAALIYRRALARTGEAALRVTHRLHDPLAIDPLTPFVGPVEVRFAEQAATAGDAEAGIDRPARTIRANTGELVLNHARGILTLDAPSARAAAGFFQPGAPVELGDTAFEPAFEYGAIMLVALDGEPLARSRRMLLQVMTEESNYGWETTARGERRTIASTGGPPIVVRNAAGKVGFRSTDAGALRFTPLDHNGRAAGPAIPGPTLELAPSTIWYLVER